MVSTVARNSGNYNLIGSVGCYNLHGDIHEAIIHNLNFLVMFNRYTKKQNKYFSEIIVGFQIFFVYQIQDIIDMLFYHNC